MDNKDIEKKIDELMGNTESRNALESIADMMLDILASTGDERAMLMLKRNELDESLKNIIADNFSVFRNAEGKLAPLISILDQAIECAKDILKEIKEG